MKKLFTLLSLLMIGASAQATDFGQLNVSCNFTGGTQPTQNFVFYQAVGGSTSSGWIVTPAGLLVSAKSSTSGTTQTITWSVPGLSDELNLKIDSSKDQCSPTASYYKTGSTAPVAQSGACFANNGGC